MGNGLGEVHVSLEVSCGPQCCEFALSPLALRSVRGACMEVQEPMTWIFEFELPITGQSPFSPDKKGGENRRGYGGNASTWPMMWRLMKV